MTVTAALAALALVTPDHPSVSAPPPAHAVRENSVAAGNWQLIFNRDGSVTIRSLVTKQAVTLHKDGTGTLDIPGFPPIGLPKTDPVDR